MKLSSAFSILTILTFMFFASFANAQVYDDSGALDSTDQTVQMDTQMDTSDDSLTATGTGTSTAGIPNTGAGGNAIAVWSILVLTALAGSAGLVYLARSRYERG